MVRQRVSQQAAWWTSELRLQPAVRWPGEQGIPVNHQVQTLQKVTQRPAAAVRVPTFDRGRGNVGKKPRTPPHKEATDPGSDGAGRDDSVTSETVCIDLAAERNIPGSRAGFVPLTTDNSAASASRIPQGGHHQCQERR